jgi:spore coat polysaccharide biosynthesis predicted glycosyltransferase SpsG
MMPARAPHIVFLTEGGPDIGLGHVSRCLSLARAAEGGRVSFLVSGDDQVAALLDGFPGEAVSSPWPVDPEGARQTVRRLAPDVIVVDSYAASSEFLATLRAVAPVVAVDDLADRALPVDVVVNGGAGAERLPYERRPGTRFLLGPRYALLDPSYAEAPARAAARRVSRVLVCLGGGRHVDGVLAALEAVDRALADCVVDVAAGPFGGSSMLDGAARDARNRVLIHRDRFGLRELMRGADVAVSGAGVTLCELCATATPTVAVCMASNQRPNAAAFEEAGAALVAGEAGAPGLADAIASALGRLAADRALRAEVAARGRALVDGRGAERVARAIARPVEARR